MKKRLKKETIDIGLLMRIFQTHEIILDIFLKTNPCGNVENHSGKWNLQTISGEGWGLGMWEALTVIVNMLFLENNIRATV